MRFWTACLLLGLALLGLILYQTDLNTALVHLRAIGMTGLAVILVVYFLSFAVDTLAWGMTFPDRALRGSWLRGLWMVHMIGEAFNRVTPLASLGGEPVKAALLKNRFAMRYRETTASLIVAQTVGTLAMLVFLVCGFVLMFGVAAVPHSYRLAASIALGVFALCVIGFYLVQRYKMFSRTGKLFASSWVGGRVHAVLELVHDVEDRLIDFYSGHRVRLVLALTLAFINWVFGAVEVYLALSFLGYDVAFTDAWVIEATVLLVRSTLFFMPADLGTQDGAIVFMCGAITGSPALALALAIVVRFRQLVWVAGGLLLGWAFADSLTVRGRA